MALRRLAALALVLAPSVALADDDLPVYGPEPRPSVESDPWAGAAAEPEPTPSDDPWAVPTTYDFDRSTSSDDVTAPSDQRFAQPPPERTYKRPWRCGGVARAHWRERWGGRGWTHYTPRLAIGIAKSKVELDEGDTAKHRSLLARIVLRRGVEVELELAKLEVDGEDARTAGISVMRVFGRRALHPYLIAGLGGGRLDVHGRANSRYDEEPRVHYAELGAGIMWRRRHLAIGADIRRGVRSVEGLHDPAPTARMAETDDKMADPDRYTRGRIMALVYF